MAKSKSEQPAAQTPAQAAAATPFTLATETGTYFGQAGRDFAASDLAAGRRVAELADNLKAAMADNPGHEFDAWEACRVSFQAGATAAGYLDPVSLWNRTVGTAQGLNLLGDKPKSPAPDAVKKGTQRATKANKIAEIAKDKTVAQLVAESHKEADPGRSLDLMLAAKKLRDDADKAAREAAAEKIKALNERIAAALATLRKAGNVKALESIAAAAERLVQAKAANAKNMETLADVAERMAKAK